MRVSILETVLIFGVIPAAIYAVIAALSVLGKKYAGTAPVHYDLRSRWTHEPVLWSAVDEVTTHAHHSGHAAIEAAPADLIGGTASGKW
jgi:hypothetical protein